MVRWGSVVVLSAVFALSTGCRFDPSDEAGIAGADGGAAGADGAACPAALHASIRVAGADAPLGPGQPYAHVRLGDTIELSAEGSCSERGPLRYRWRIEPSTTRIESTAVPGLAAPTLTVYPLVREQYSVRLEVEDGVGRQTAQVFAFQAHGWQRLEHLPAGASDVRDLATDDESLWIASSGGALRADLEAPDVGPYPSVGDLAGGASIEANLSAVATDGDGLVWFAHRDSRERLWRLDVAAGEVEEIELPASAKVRDVATGASNVWLASDKGVFVGDGDEFAAARGDDSFAVGIAGGDAFAGGASLFPLPDGDSIDVFSGGNDKIRALAGAGQVVWIGGEDKGIARLVGGAIDELFDQSGALPTNAIRALAVDELGDVWAASDEGVLRYKADRKVWLTMGVGAGLGQRLDLAAIAADRAIDRRGVFAGGPAGLVGMWLP